MRILLVHSAAQPFDLENGPLWRARALRVDEEEYLFSFHFHHTISDYWSFGILARERVQLYPMFLALLSVPPVGWPQPSDHGPRRREALADA